MTGKQQVQKQKQLSAYQSKTTHDIFFMTMEWLEKYIEVAGHYSDWENRKQIKNNRIKRPDIVGNPKKAENSFSTQLVLFKAALEDDPSFLREEVKEEFYRWINATRIDAKNCPEKLKYILFGINEVLEGRGEKVQKDIENRKREIDPNSPEYMEQMSKVFALIQTPMQDEKETKKSLADKTHRDIKIESKFSSGDSKLGGQIFGNIAKEVSSSYQNFHHFPQEGQQSAVSNITSTSFLTNLDEVVQNVKTNPQNWRLDEITTHLGDYYGKGKVEEWVLIDNRFARLDANAYDEQGKLDLNNNSIYRWENFNSQQRFEIKKAKNISGDYLTNGEIKWVIKEFKDDPRVWKIGTFKGVNCFFHNSAQGNDNEIGTLIHNKQKFNETEWAEIKKIKLIDNIKKHINNFEFRTILVSKGQYWDNINKRWVNYGKEKQETMLVHKSVKITENDYNEYGYLIIKQEKMFQENRFNQEEWAEIKSALKVNNIKNEFKLWQINFEDNLGYWEHWYIRNSIDARNGVSFDPENMYKVKDLNEKELKKIGYIKSEAKSQTTSISTPENKKDNKGIGTGGILAIIGAVSAVVIAGVVWAVKKKDKKPAE